jgi:hypothetical protein
MKYDLDTFTGQNLLAATIHQIFDCRCSELPYVYGEYHPDIADELANCINIPDRKTLLQRHQEALRTATERYFLIQATALANAFAAYIGVSGMPESLPRSEFRGGVLVSPDEFTEALHSQYEWGHELTRIEKAVGEALGNGDYEATTMYEAMRSLHTRIDQSRIEATMWAVLLLYTSDASNTR